MSDWLHAHRRSVLFALALAAIAGVFAALRLPVSLFPNIAFPRLVVSIDAGDRPADRMVVEVTRPLEQAVRSVPGVAGLRSTSSRGSAELSVNFNWGTDMVAAQLQVESAINRMLPELPAGLRYEVRRMDPTVFPVYGLSLTSATRDPVALRDFAWYTLRPLLSSVPGIAAIDVQGGELAELQVIIDPARLAAAGLSVQDLANAIAANDAIAGVGRMEDRHRLYLVLADSRLQTAQSLGHIVVRGGPRGLLTLADVAEVRTGTAPRYTRVTADGRDAVLVNIRQTRGANAPALVRAIRARLDAHRSEFPHDIQLTSFYDQSQLVLAAAASVRDAILIGAVLSGLVLLVFLRDLRLTLIVAIALPAVLAATSLLLTLLGQSFNIMTLGGMAAAVGLIVDDAVVIVEHLARRAEGRVTAQAQQPLLHAAREMLKPLSGSSAATIVIFVPLAFLSGVTGGFFKALALTMASALLISYLVALGAVPLLADRLLRGRSAAHARNDSLFGRVLARYAQLAGHLLRRPLWIAIAVLVVLAGGALSYRALPSGFMPHMDEGGFILDYRARPGASLAETDRLLRQVETLIRATPEVASYSRRTGVQLGGGLTEANEGDYFIRLKPPPRRGIDAVMAGLRRQIEHQVPGLDIETAQMMEDLIGDLTAVPQPIEVKLFGPDLATLQALAPQVAARLGRIPGIVEVRDGLNIAGDAIEFHVDRDRAAIEGLDADAVAAQLSSLIGGSVVGRVQQGEKLIDIRLRGAAGLRSHVEDLSSLQLRAPDGHLLPVSRVAKVSIAAGQAQITRENLEQMVAVTARLENLDLGTAMREVRSAMAAMDLPAGVRVDYGGLYAQQQSSFHDLTIVFAAALLLVVALLLYLYERWAIVAAILATVLLAAAGVFIGLWLTGTELDISAMMGLTMIIGMVTEITVFYFAELDPSQTPTPALLIEAGQLRLRPILMTTLIAILALMPLALGLGTGAAMQTPLAIAIISGLIAAVPLVLLAMPSFYLLLATGLRGNRKPHDS